MPTALMKKIHKKTQVAKVGSENYVYYCLAVKEIANADSQLKMKMRAMEKIAGKTYHRLKKIRKCKQILKTNKKANRISFLLKFFL